MLSAVCLSACEENKGTRTVVYTEPLPYLTIMTQTTTTPADTYSEYMATYLEKETGTENFFAVPHMYGVGADTFMVNFPSEMVTAAPFTDTLAVFPHTETVPPPEFFSPVTETVTVSSPEEASEPESTEISQSEGSAADSVTSTAASTITSLLELPAPDTASPHAAPTDTAPTMYSAASETGETDSNTSASDGGTDNAH